MWINDRATKTCKRWNSPNHAHELTFSTYLNHDLLKFSVICDFLAESILKAQAHYRFSLWAYVFMPNHVHLLIYPKEKDYSVSKILGAIKRPTARKAIDWLEIHHPENLKSLKASEKNKKYHFWQKGGGYDRNINNIEVLINSTKYIHRNPVRKELVKAPQEWYYSSAASWKGISEEPLKINKEDWPILGQ